MYFYIVQFILRANSLSPHIFIEKIIFHCILLAKTIVQRNMKLNISNNYSKTLIGLFVCLMAYEPILQEEL